MSQSFAVRYLRLGDARVSEERLQAESEAILRQGLAAQGYTVLSVRTRRSQTTARSKPGKPQQGHFALFCRQVRTLIHAGMTVVEAVE